MAKVTKTTDGEGSVKIDIKGKLPDMSGCEIKHKTTQCGGVYGVGMIGALVYFISTATSFWGGVLGILKSIVWPAFLVHGLLKLAGL